MVEAGNPDWRYSLGSREAHDDALATRQNVLGSCVNDCLPFETEVYARLPIKTPLYQHVLMHKSSNEWIR